MSDLIRTAVVTGGHSFGVTGFHLCFRNLRNIDAFIQHMDDFASSPEEERDRYDCIVFYTMLLNIPEGDDLPLYAGDPKSAIKHLGMTSQGIVMLHHSIVAYPQWELWSEMVGMKNRKTRGYRFDQRIQVDFARTDHPIVRGMQPWDMVDETYQLDDADGENALPGNEILLTVNQPESMRTVGWVRGYRESRVFCLQLGHDSQAWNHPNFQEILTRGIAWTTGRF